jgi:hypothetical protein
LNGDSEISFSSQIKDVEVFYNARDDFVQMADNGSLKKLHESHKLLSESSESQYINTKDRL